MIWSGVYDSFQEAQSERSAFVHPTWVQRSVERLRDVSSGEVDISATTTVDGSLITGPILAELASGPNVKILDVGGNLGQLAIETNRKFRDANLSWSVLEREDFLQASRQFTKLPEEVEFYSDIKQLDGREFDIVHFGSSIQYIDEWVSFLGELASKQHPKWFVIADAMSGEAIPTFVTRQKYYDGYLVSRFINLGEFVSVFSDFGFDLTFVSPFLNESNKTYYPEHQLPDENQIKFPLDLIFKSRNI